MRALPGTLIMLTLLWLAAPAAADFGVTPGSFEVTMSTLQAGGHPDLSTSFVLNQDPVDVPTGRLKDAQFDLPAGLLGSPTAAPRCTMSDLVQEPPACPPEAAVGVARLILGSFSGGGVSVKTSLIYNIVPYKNEPAAFAFVAIYPVRLDARLRSDSDNGLHISATNISEAQPILSTSITLWGVPSEHNGPGAEVDDHGSHYGGQGDGAPLAFMTNPSRCGENLSSGLAVSAWPELTGLGTPVPARSASSSASTAPLTGCDRLSFAPSIEIRPDTVQADAPAGYEIDIHVPQNKSALSPAAPQLKDAVITLPPGVVVSPSSADGLQGCSEAQLGLHSLAPVTCPDASKLGPAQLDTPLLANPLTGSAYLATPDANPFHTLMAIYVVTEGEGAMIKLAGEAHLDHATGQLTIKFLDNPQLPFSDLKLSFRGGARAMFANPPDCGIARSTAALTPWSSTQAAIASSSFRVTPDASGAGCSSPPPFAPTFSAGTVNPTAGAFSPFTLTLSRADAQQDFGAVQVRTPPGVLGMLARVPLCPEPQASTGQCGVQSLIGHTTLGAGPGPHPIYLAGNAFLTGPYGGAPFGLSLVVHALAGPFDLGTVIVRAAISVDPHSAALTVTSDPFPQILDGIPLQLKVINVTLDRPAFTFNPTNCSAHAVAATISATHGASATASSPFAATGCTKLAFTPKFTASSSAKTSRATGAALNLKIAFPDSRQANIGSVDIAFPKQLPARLTTIQHACLMAVFDVNPAACPARSLVGTGKGYSPALPGLLAGPMYLVSHGRKTVPALVLLLQGDGVRIDLTGAIHVSGAGVTRSEFGSMPDAPISSFEINLPRGPHSALTNTGDMCKKPLVMPTTITAQNGAVMRQATKIKVTGCPKPKRSTRASAPRRTTRSGR